LYERKKINEIIEKSNLIFIFNENNIDNFNYSNPLQMSLKIETIPISNYYNKIYNYYFEHKNFISENGIFSKKNYSFYYYISKELDLDNIETDPLLTINFLSNCYYETIFRRYIGIKDFLESLTLLFQFNFVILKVFINFLRRNSKCFEIVHKFFFSDIKIKENKINLSHNSLINKSKIIKNYENEINKSSEIIKNSKINFIKMYQSNYNNLSNDNNNENYNNLLNNFHSKIYHKNKNIKQIKLNWYNYIIPNCLLMMKKSNNNSLKILKNFKNLIYKSISIENIYKIYNKSFIINENIKSKNKNIILNL